VLLWPTRPMVSWGALNGHGQKVSGGDLPLLLCPGDTSPGLLPPVLGSPVQKRQGSAGKESSRAPQRRQRAWSTSLMRKG